MTSEKEQSDETQGTVAKSISGAAIISYALGLLVTNVYLVSIDVSDFSSLKPKFVLTGAWAFAILFFAIAPGISFGFLIYNRQSGDEHGKVVHQESSSWKRSLKWCLGYLAASVVLRIIFLYWLWPEIPLEDAVLRVSWWCVIVAGASSFTILLAFLMGTSTCFVKLDRLGAAWLTRFTFVLFAVAVLGLGIYLISMGFYPYIREGLGGGKPIKARLILSEHAKNFWQESGIEPSGLKELPSFVVDVLYQSETQIVVSVPYQSKSSGEARPIILKRDLVDAILPFQHDVPSSSSPSGN